MGILPKYWRLVAVAVAPVLLLAVLGCGATMEFIEQLTHKYGGAISVHAADVDGDGDVDVLGTSFDGAQITWWENDGSGSFSQHTISDDYLGPASVCAADLDGDDDMDVIVAGFHECAITWWENSRPDSHDCSEPVSWERHDISHALWEAVWVYPVDMDDDGDLDVLSATQGDDNAIHWWENAPDTWDRWRQHLVREDLEWASCVYATDMDGDGDVDVLGSADEDDVVIWWENTGGTEVRLVEHVIREKFDGASSVLASDLDGDGDPDVLAAAYGENAISWWENSGGRPPSFTEHSITTDFGWARAVYAADVDGDGDTDVLGAAQEDDAIAWWENTGESTPSFNEHLITTTFDGASPVHAADVDGDGDLDVLGAAIWDDEVTWWENESNDHVPAADPIAWTEHTISSHGGN